MLELKNMETNADRRRRKLAQLCDERGLRTVAERAGLNYQSLEQIIKGVLLPPKQDGSRNPRKLGDEAARKIEEAEGLGVGWFDIPAVPSPESKAPAPHAAPAEEPGQPADLVITEFAIGGGMGTTGRLLLDDQPGIIKSWRVTDDWVRLNVPNHTGVRNLCIVTGFGPSMRPMFNPGDPLLVDTGVKVVNHEGVYFFRVGDEGFIKMIQRVPDPNGAGVMLQIISKNPDYPPYPISPKNPHFQVLGKVLTVWRSEQH